MSGFIYLSKEGMEKLKDELNYLKSIERPKIINQITGFGKSFKSMTLDTVKGFLTDSKKSRFSL